MVRGSFNIDMIVIFAISTNSQSDYMPNFVLGYRTFWQELNYLPG